MKPEQFKRLQALVDGWRIASEEAESVPVYRTLKLCAQQLDNQISALRESQQEQVEDEDQADQVEH